MHPTPIPDLPELRTWLSVALALAGGSGLALASHLHVRWLDRRGVRMVPVHLAVLTVTAGLGLLLLGPGWLWHGPVLLLPVAVLAGAAAAALVIPGDGWITRTMARRPAVAPRPAARGSGEGAGASRLRPVGLGGAGGAGGAGAASGAPGHRGGNRTSVRNVSGGRSWTPTRRDTDLGLGLGWLLATAVAEEFVFRGVLLRLALQPHALLAQCACVAAGVLAFALSHIFFGWGQVLAKLPLSVLATVATLLLGTVAAAALAHALFNWHVWRRRVTTTAPAAAAAACGAGVVP